MRVIRNWLTFNGINGIGHDSHKLFPVKCSVCLSSKCRGVFSLPYRRVRQALERNNGKIICKYCYHSSENRSSNKYRLNNINSSKDAYLLGWIASDGHVFKYGVTISIHKRDLLTLIKLRDIVDSNLPIAYSGNMCNFKIFSMRFSKDVCKWLSISPGKKSHMVSFPDQLDSKLYKYFIRGYFEGDGTVTTKTSKVNQPVASICSSSYNMRIALLNILNSFGINGYISGTQVYWSHTNAIKFLDYIYKYNPNLTLNRKYDLYLYWKPYVFDLRKLKVNKSKVRIMRNLYVKGVSCKDISHRFSLGYSTVFRIVKQQTWRHVC